jgi:endonuclease G
MLKFSRAAAAAAAVAVCVFLLPVGASRADEGAEHLVIGNPSGATTNKARPDNYLVRKKQYALSYNNSKGTPNWVSWHLSKKWLGKAHRTNPFAPDTSLPKEFFVVRPNDYRATGFNRGHMCPAADRSVSKEDMDATFLMTNMVPQAPDLNQKTWEKLEVYCRDQARDDKELYILAGPAGRGGVGDKGSRTYLPARGGKILVPAKCWKVVLILPPGTTHPKKVTAEAGRAFAVIMPNIQGLDPDWRKYSVMVRDVEKLTGYTFFSNMAPDVAKELKTRTDVRAKPTPKGKDGVLPAFVKGCVIGNKKSKVYHVPGGRSYEVARKSKNAIFFKTAEDAKRAGYKPASR